MRDKSYVLHDSNVTLLFSNSSAPALLHCFKKVAFLFCRKIYREKINPKCSLVYVNILFCLSPIFPPQEAPNHI